LREPRHQSFANRRQEWCSLWHGEAIPESFTSLAFVDEKGREAVAEVVEPESLTRLKPDADLNRGWANFILCHHACAQGVLPFIFVEGKIQSSGFASSV
jgi:hypothetical protein